MFEGMLVMGLRVGGCLGCLVWWCGLRRSGIVDFLRGRRRREDRSDDFEVSVYRSCSVIRVKVLLMGYRDKRHVSHTSLCHTQVFGRKVATV